MNKYRIYDSTICFNNNDTEVNVYNRWDGSLPHYQLFTDTMHELGQLGFRRKEKDV